MRILLCSHLFHPSVGGIEQVSQVLAHEFSLAGHTVKVVTSTAESDGAKFLFEVVRRPSPLELLRLILWSQVVFHNNISLRLCWPLAFVRRPWVIAHHTWIARTHESIGLRDRIKQFMIRFARNSGAKANESRARAKWKIFVRRWRFLARPRLSPAKV